MMGLTNQAQAQVAVKFKQAHDFEIGQPTLNCVAKESEYWGIALHDFLAINSIEMGKTKPIGNTNGSQDLGAFQINSIHLPKVATLFGGSYQDLLQKGCFNAHVAGYLMSVALSTPNKAHLDYYTRLAGYHSWTARYNRIYRIKLVKYANEWQQYLNSTP